MTANITSASIVKRIGYMWAENHSGEGHGLCKKEECYKARRKLENRAVNPRQEFRKVYGMISDQEVRQGTWTKEDEEIFLKETSDGKTE
jgi:hypothetical protein